MLLVLVVIAGLIVEIGCEMVLMSEKKIIRDMTEIILNSLKDFKNGKKHRTCTVSCTPVWPHKFIDIVISRACFNSDWSCFVITALSPVSRSTDLPDHHSILNSRVRTVQPQGDPCVTSV